MHIFQQLYNTSKFPDGWLQTLISPIHKMSLKSDPPKYGPISLTWVLCKVMEHIILSRWKHLHKHTIIHFQHGFHTGLSSESQLIETIHDWITAIDNKKQIDAILLHFAKVPHKHFSSKLGFYGRTGNIINWVKSLCSHRKQRVLVNHALSNNICFIWSTTGLRTRTFLLYINDTNNTILSIDENLNMPLLWGIRTPPPYWKRIA